MVKKAAKKSSTSTEQGTDFETTINELEALVSRMEEGEQTLEQSLQDFERGVALTRRCEAARKQAEQKVETLLAQTEQAERVPFDDE